MPEPEDGLEEDFPLGDGTAETDAAGAVPLLRRVVEIGLDPGSGMVQEYVEDCQVCCRPWRVLVSYHSDGSATVNLEADDVE